MRNKARTRFGVFAPNSNAQDSQRQAPEKARDSKGQGLGPLEQLAPLHTVDAAVTVLSSEAVAGADCLARNRRATMNVTAGTVGTAVTQII